MTRNASWRGQPARTIAHHAGALGPCPGFAAPPLRRYLIQIGDQDANVPLPTVRASATRLAASGSPAELQIIPGHTHWFYDIGPALASQARAFFQREDTPAGVQSVPGDWRPD